MKTKDTSVFSDKELFEINDSLFAMGNYWNTTFDKFKEDNPDSKKTETRPQRSQKYYSQKYYKECLNLRRTLHQPLNDKIFSQAFELAMK